MLHLSIQFCLVALLFLCLVQGNLLDADIYDGNCTGESGNLENVGTTLLDRVIRKVQGRPITKFAYNTVKRALQDPDSSLSKMMGSAAVNPMEWDDSETFNFKEPGEEVPMYWMHFLARAFGSTATVYSYL